MSRKEICGGKMNLHIVLRIEHKSIKSIFADTLFKRVIEFFYSKSIEREKLKMKLRHEGL